MCVLVCCQAPAGASAASDTASFAALAERCAPWVHPATLNAVVRHESRGNPFAIGVNGGRLERQPTSKSEAVATARWLQANGYDFDAGLGQINVRNLKRLNMTVEEVFEPCPNLRASGLILANCYERASRKSGKGAMALQAALSCYNTNDLRRGLSNGYVGKVLGGVGLKLPAIPLPLPVAAPAPNDQVAQIAAESDASRIRATSKDVFAEDLGATEPKGELSRNGALNELALSLRDKPASR